MTSAALLFVVFTLLQPRLPEVVCYDMEAIDRRAACNARAKGVFASTRLERSPVHQALILVDYLLRNGSTRFTEDCKHRARDVAKLTRYKHYDANNEDDAKDGTFRLFCNCLCSAARAKAKAVYEMLTDDAKLAEERAKAEKIKDVKAQGMGNDSFGLSMRENGGGGNNLDRQMALEAAWDRPDRPYVHCAAVLCCAIIHISTAECYTIVFVLTSHWLYAMQR